MNTPRKKPRPKDEPVGTGREAGGPLTPVTPVAPKIGETPGNLQARSEAFKRRHGKSR